jgi:hypothetical protein
MDLSDYDLLEGFESLKLFEQYEAKSQYSSSSLAVPNFCHTAFVLPAENWWAESGRYQ